VDLTVAAGEGMIAIPLPVPGIKLGLANPRHAAGAARLHAVVYYLPLLLLAAIPTGVCTGYVS